MAIVVKVLDIVISIYIFLLVARAILSWIPVRWPEPLRPIVVFIYDVTEFALGPLRRVLPTVPLGRGVGLDLSPLVLIFLLTVLRWLMYRLT